MIRLEEIEELDETLTTWTRDDYPLTWTIGQRRFNKSLCESGYTKDDICEELEIGQTQLHYKILGKYPWTAFELDYLEEYLDLVAPDK